MPGVWTSDYGSPEVGGKEYEGNQEKSLKGTGIYGMISNRDVPGDFYSLRYNFPCSRVDRGPETIRRCKKHE